MRGLRQRAGRRLAYFVRALSAAPRDYIASRFGGRSRVLFRREVAGHWSLCRRGVGLGGLLSTSRSWKKIPCPPSKHRTLAQRTYWHLGSPSGDDAFHTQRLLFATAVSAPGHWFYYSQPGNLGGERNRLTAAPSLHQDQSGAFTLFAERIRNCRRNRDPFPLRASALTRRSTRTPRVRGLHPAQRAAG